MRAYCDYFEWDPERAEAERRRAAEGVDSQDDREVRMRVGEVIARAMLASRRKPQPLPSAKALVISDRKSC